MYKYKLRKALNIDYEGINELPSGLIKTVNYFIDALKKNASGQGKPVTKTDSFNKNHTIRTIRWWLDGEWYQNGLYVSLVSYDFLKTYFIELESHNDLHHQLLEEITTQSLDYYSLDLLINRAYEGLPHNPIPIMRALYIGYEGTHLIHPPFLELYETALASQSEELVNKIAWWSIMLPDQYWEAIYKATESAANTHPSEEMRNKLKLVLDFLIQEMQDLEEQKKLDESWLDDLDE